MGGAPSDQAVGGQFWGGDAAAVAVCGQLRSLKASQSKAPAAAVAAAAATTKESQRISKWLQALPSRTTTPKQEKSFAGSMNYVAS